MNEGSTGVVVHLSVDDRDDPGTGAGRALYSIINGDPTRSFEIHTNPDNNEGMLAVVKVRCQGRRPGAKTRWTKYSANPFLWSSSL